MSNLVDWLDRRVSIAALILSFWALYWGLNGADEFFNGTSEPNLAVTFGMVHDAAGQPLYKLHPLQPIGWYGVSQAPRFIAYFGQLGIGASTALAVLYTFCVLQLVLAALFATLLVWRERVLCHLAFKAGLAMFALLAVGDILFGDRMELWHHGTYFALSVVSYDLWYRADRYHHTREILGAA